ncbi:DoxX family protein [Neopusillimonas maritima]|nr:DoxX family membrane protein [Neopusillimonas maritima]
MIFFISLLVLTGLARLIGWLGVDHLRQRHTSMRIALAIAMIFFGIDHLITPERYLPMIESWLPFPNSVIAITGICEIGGGLGLLTQRFRRLAGLMLAIYFVAVFPANVHNAIYGLQVQGLPTSEWYYWARLCFQPLAVWWALYCTGYIYNIGHAKTSFLRQR